MPRAPDKHVTLYAEVGTLNSKFNKTNILVERRYNYTFYTLDNFITDNGITKYYLTSLAIFLPQYSQWPKMFCDFIMHFN